MAWFAEPVIYLVAMGLGLGRYLEEIHKELKAQFNYQPEQPILIEVFHKHELFSGRVVAMPDLHTIGACTGPLVAMVSTRDTQNVITKPFTLTTICGAVREALAAPKKLH